MAEDKIVPVSRKAVHPYLMRITAHLDELKARRSIGAWMLTVGSWLWHWIAHIHTIEWLDDGIKSHLPKRFTMPLIPGHWWMFIIGIAWLTALVLFPRKKIVATAPATSQKDRKAAELPVLRPKIYPAAFGKSPMTFGGLTIFNEGETAFLVSIPEVQLGESTLKFKDTLSHLSKSDGKKLCEAWIEIPSGTHIGGAALSQAMGSQNIDKINVTINYKDGDNRWYETICEIERNLMAAEGLDTKFIRQVLVAEPLSTPGEQPVNKTPIPADAPTVMLEYHWQQENASGKTDSINKPVVFTNISDQPAINVRLEIKHNDWIARFGPIPHLFKNEPRELQAALQYGTFNLSEQRNSFSNLSRQFITVLQPAADERFEKSTCVPATVTYSDKNGEEFVSEYEFKWNHKKREAQAFLTRHGRPKLDSFGQSA